MAPYIIKINATFKSDRAQPARITGARSPNGLKANTATALKIPLPHIKNINMTFFFGDMMDV